MTEFLIRRLDHLGDVVGRFERGRRFSIAILVLGAVVLAALLVDRVVGIPVMGLRILNLAVAAIAIVGFVACVIVRRRSYVELARLVERRYPELDERLLSLAALPADVPPSPLVDGLRDETDRRAAPLDFRAAFDPPRKVVRFAVGVSLLLAASFAVSADARRLVRRVALAWTPAVHGFDIRLSPAAGHVPLGQPLLVVAESIPTDPDARLPISCTLTIADGRRLVMEPTGDGQFTAVIAEMPDRLTVVAQAGERVSEPVTWVGSPPVRLLASPRITITPPPYAIAFSADEFDGGLPVRALQFSRLRYRFAFDRRPVDAHLRWTEADSIRDIPLTIAADGRSAHADVLAAVAGPCVGELELTAEHGITSRVPLVGGTVWVDPPPTIRSFSLGAAVGTSFTAPPDEILRPSATIEDAVGLSRIELEWRVNGGDLQRETLEIVAGAQRLAGEWTVPLRGKVVAGDRIELRLRATDNRSLTRGQLQSGDRPIPSETLAPQITYAPAGDGWLSFDIRPNAEPIEKQAITAARENVAERLRAIRKKIAETKAAAAKIADAGHITPLWTAAQIREVGEVRKKNGLAQTDLRELGGEAVARLARDIADKELASADKALARTETPEVTAASREIHLRHADAEFKVALKRIDELLDLNEEAAQEQLKQWEAEQLARREEALAQELTADAADIDRAKAEQDEIAARFEKWAGEQAKIKALASKADREQTAEMAKRADKLAASQRQQAKASAGARGEAMKSALADLAARQLELAHDIDRLGRDIHLGLDDANVTTSADPAKKAARSLADAKIEESLTQQKQSLDELKKAGQALDALAQLGVDAKTAAAKLAEAQQRLIDDLEKLGQDFPRITPDETVKRLAELHARQTAIGQILDKLPIPAGNKAAESAKRDARESAGQAADEIRRKDLLPARDSMEKTRDQLQRLKATLPDAPKRGQEFEAEKEKRRDALAKTAESLADRQKELIDQTNKAVSEVGQAESAKSGPAEKDANDAIEKLKDDVIKLSQSMDGPGEKDKASEAAKDLDDAKSAMKAAADERGEGKFDSADKKAEDAAMRIEAAGQKLSQVAESLPMPTGDDAKLSQAVRDARSLLKSQNPNDMKQAAQAIRQLSRLGGSPSRGRTPGGPSSASSDVLPTDIGSAWGELPGEVRTRLMREWRTRYGAEYEEVIQRYFRNLAKTP